MASGYKCMNIAMNFRGIWSSLWFLSIILCLKLICQWNWMDVTACLLHVESKSKMPFTGQFLSADYFKIKWSVWPFKLSASFFLLVSVYKHWTGIVGSASGKQPYALSLLTLTYCSEHSEEHLPQISVILNAELLVTHHVKKNNFITVAKEK